MILDSLQRASLYGGLGPRIAAAFEYLAAHDFAETPDGRREIDGDRLVAIVQRYRTKPPAEARWEAHRQYVDVQYVAAGVERMGWLALDDGLQVAAPYDPVNDVVFFDARGQFFDVPAGHFAIFAPGDVHAPGLAAAAGPGHRTGELDDVLKVVVKCRVEFRS